MPLYIKEGSKHRSFAGFLSFNEGFVERGGFDGMLQETKDIQILRAENRVMNLPVVVKTVLYSGLSEQGELLNVLKMY